MKCGWVLCNVRQWANYNPCAPHADGTQISGLQTPECLNSWFHHQDGIAEH